MIRFSDFCCCLKFENNDHTVPIHHPVEHTSKSNFPIYPIEVSNNQVLKGVIPCEYRQFCLREEIPNNNNSICTEISCIDTTKSESDVRRLVTGYSIPLDRNIDEHCTLRGKNGPLAFESQKITWRPDFHAEIVPTCF